MSSVNTAIGSRCSHFRKLYLEDEQNFLNINFFNQYFVDSKTSKVPFSDQNFNGDLYILGAVH